MSTGNGRKMTAPPFTFLPFNPEDERMRWMWPPVMAYPGESTHTGCPNCLRLKKSAVTMKRAKVPEAKYLKTARERRQMYERIAHFTAFQSFERDFFIDRMMQDIREKSEVADLSEQMSRTLGGFSEGDGRQTKTKHFDK